MKNEIDYLYPLLDDWQLISSISYCNSILNRKTEFHKTEFFDMCFYLFDGDEKRAMDSLIEVKQLYEKEYLKRHSN